MPLKDARARQDVLYYFAPEQAARITVSLCPSSVFSDAFDTKLYILGDLLSPQGGLVAPLACNDDFCGSQSQITVRFPSRAALAVQVIAPLYRMPEPFYMFLVERTAIKSVIATIIFSCQMVLQKMLKAPLPKGACAVWSITQNPGLLHPFAFF